MLPDTTQTILHAKSKQRLTFRDLADRVGCDPVFLAAACYRLITKGFIPMGVTSNYLALDLVQKVAEGF